MVARLVPLLDVGLLPVEEEVAGLLEALLEIVSWYYKGSDSNATVADEEGEEECSLDLPGGGGGDCGTAGGAFELSAKCTTVASK